MACAKGDAGIGGVIGIVGEEVGDNGIGAVDGEGGVDLEVDGCRGTPVDEAHVAAVVLEGVVVAGHLVAGEADLEGADFAVDKPVHVAHIHVAALGVEGVIDIVVEVHGRAVDLDFAHGAVLQAPAVLGGGFGAEAGCQEVALVAGHSRHSVGAHGQLSAPLGVGEQAVLVLGDGDVAVGDCGEGNGGVGTASVETEGGEGGRVGSAFVQAVHPVVGGLAHRLADDDIGHLLDVAFGIGEGDLECLVAAGGCGPCELHIVAAQVVDAEVIRGCAVGGVGLVAGEVHLYLVHIAHGEVVEIVDFAEFRQVVVDDEVRVAAVEGDGSTVHDEALHLVGGDVEAVVFGIVVGHAKQIHEGRVAFIAFHIHGLGVGDVAELRGVHLAAVGILQGVACIVLGGEGDGGVGIAAVEAVGADGDSVGGVLRQAVEVERYSLGGGVEFAVEVHLIVTVRGAGHAPGKVGVLGAVVVLQVGHCIAVHAVDVVASEDHFHGAHFAQRGGKDIGHGIGDGVAFAVHNAVERYAVVAAVEGHAHAVVADALHTVGIVVKYSLGRILYREREGRKLVVVAFRTGELVGAVGVVLFHHPAAAVEGLQVAASVVDDGEGGLLGLVDVEGGVHRLAVGAVGGDYHFVGLVRLEAVDGEGMYNVGILHAVDTEGVGHTRVFIPVDVGIATVIHDAVHLYCRAIAGVDELHTVHLADGDIERVDSVSGIAVCTGVYLHAVIAAVDGQLNTVEVNLIQLS